MSTVLYLLIPAFFLVIALEWFVSHKKKDNKYSVENTAMNISIGAVDRLGSLFSMALLYLALDFVYRNFAFLHFSSGWYQWLTGYIAADFVSYWYHRYSHRINILWAGHITHHSSPKFNLTNGFRTSLFQGLNRIPFWVILPVLGFEPAVLMIIFNISGVYDFFMHTPYFPRNKWLETFLITPSLHKVHHGKNKIYIDKNYGATLSIWDRMFGTFQPETETVEFGITGNYRDNQPLAAITYYYTLLISSVNKMRGNLFHLLFGTPSGVNSINEGNSGENRQLAGKYVRSFALFNLICGVIIDFIALMSRNKMHVVEFLAFYLLGLIAIIRATGILNGSVSMNTRRYKILYLIGALIVILCLLTNSLS